jgi:hypothetical protein
MVNSSKDALKDRLACYRQIKISVVGRKSGRTISRRDLVRAISCQYGAPMPSGTGMCFESINSDRCTRRTSGIPGHSRNRSKGRRIGGREVPR